MAHKKRIGRSLPKGHIKRIALHTVHVHGAKGAIYPTLLKDKATALAYARMERSEGRDARYAGTVPFHTKPSRYIRRDWAELKDVRTTRRRRKRSQLRRTR